METKGPGALLEASKQILQRCESRNDQTKPNKGLLLGIKTGIGMAVQQSQRRSSTYLDPESEVGGGSR